MKITRNRIVTLDFKVTDESGQTLDSSKDSEPFSYLHGSGNLVPGLESAMEGKSAGDAFSVTVKPEEGYGLRDESKVHFLPKALFDSMDDLEVGQPIQIEDPSGLMVMTVTNIEEEGVTVDGNHQLAGVTLNFDIKVIDVREATTQEITQGFPIDQHDNCDGCDSDCCDDCHDGCCS